MSQQSRRHDPYPWTWEIPLGILLVILMVHRLTAGDQDRGDLHRAYPDCGVRQGRVRPHSPEASSNDRFSFRLDL